MTIGAIIVAGGIGRRMNAGMPKQLLELEGRPIIEWTLERFVRCGDVREIVIVSEPTIALRLALAAMPLSTADCPIRIVDGGRERQDSVRNGLAALTGDCDITVVHDAVRPFVTPGEITAVAETALEHGAASLMRPVHETVKIVRGHIIESTLDRSTVWLTQTPQAFRRETLIEAHDRARAEGFTGTDDCILAERIGVRVRAVPGSEYNIKITTPGDLALAGALMDLFRAREDAC